MTVESDSPFMHTLEGTVNGEPHTITFDVKERVAQEFAFRGVNISEEELTTESAQRLHDLQRIQEAIRTPRPAPGRLQQAAAKIGAFLRR